MPLDLLVIGDCAVDQYMDIMDSSVLHDPETKEDRLCFLHGSKVPVEKFFTYLAGNSCHVGIGAARLGLRTAIYTELGEDDYGKKFVREFQGEGIDIRYCKLNTNTSTNVHAIILHAGDRTIFSYHEPRKYKLDFARLEKPKWIYYTSLAQGYESFQDELIEWLKSNSAIGVTYNPGSIQLTNIEKVKEFIDITDVLFLNREEGCKILGIPYDESIEIEPIHKGLHEIGAKLTLITEGSKGASAYDGQKLYKKPAIKLDVPVVNKTGAGDSYAAAFLSALHYGKSIDTAMEWGNKNSASTVKIMGCIEALLKKSEIE